MFGEFDCHALTSPSMLKMILRRLHPLAFQMPSMLAFAAEVEEFQ
jgi:hypothetical protein